MADPSEPENRQASTLLDWTFTWMRAAGMAPLIATDWWLRQAQGGHAYTTTAVPDPRVVARTMATLLTALSRDPAQLSVLATKLASQHLQVWQHAATRILGVEGGPPVTGPDKGDRRFADATWSTDPWFDYLKQAYLVSARWSEALADAAPGLDERTRHQARFFLRLWADALSPTNFLASNPKALRTALETRGDSVRRGIDHLVGDLARYHGEVRPHQTQEEAFRIGENIAITPGAVIFRNDLIELIQYSPSTTTVFTRPLLIVPPFINKYYIMDLKPKNSFVRWAVEEGHTVFMISWINPDQRHADKRFDDYMRDGPLAAIDAIAEATGERQVNAIGYCIGGTVLACTLAVLAARGQETERFGSATFFTCMLDYSEPGDLGVFLDEQQITEMERQMQRAGYLDGAYMAHVFNLLRGNELVWGVHVNNYLYGREPPAFDLLYWNGDSTRIPAVAQSWYVRSLYLRNLLMVPDALCLDGTPLDLRRITTPSYFLSTQEDHIAPWRSTYKGPTQFTGPVRFVLGGSGHIAGAMNPPANNKYFYLVNEAAGVTLPPTPEAWLEGTERRDGSWWPDWAQWVAQHAGERVPARDPGAGPLPVLDPAPGRYVQVRADEAAPQPGLPAMQAAGLPAMQQAFAQMMGPLLRLAEGPAVGDKPGASS